MFAKYSMKMKEIMNQQKVTFEHCEIVAFHDLVAEMLRATVQMLDDIAVIKEYTYCCGLILQKLPFCKTSSKSYLLEKLNDINILDPSGTSESWGIWAKEMAIAFKVELPEKPVKAFDFNETERMRLALQKLAPNYVKAES